MADNNDATPIIPAGVEAGRDLISDPADSSPESPGVGTAIAASPAADPETQPGTARMSRSRIVGRRFLRNKTAVVGLIGLILMAIFVLVAPHVIQWGYADIDTKSFLKPPGGEHPLGTTQSGRDVLALTIEGLRKSLMIGLGVAILQTTVAAAIGASAAYFGGWFERVALWVIDLLLVVPSFLIIAIFMVRSGGSANGSTITLILLLAGFGWMLSARVVRSMTLSVKNLDYVRAARYSNVGAGTIIVRHILPNISSLLVIDMTLGVASAVLSETNLSFFGFGVQSPETSLGTLIGEGQRSATTYPWIFLSPATALVAMLVFVNFVGDGVRDAFDPSSKSGGDA